MIFQEALERALTTGVAIRPKSWTGGHAYAHYVITWHNPPGTKGCWTIRNLIDPDTCHMALMPTLHDIRDDWEEVAIPQQ